MCDINTLRINYFYRVMEIRQDRKMNNQRHQQLIFYKNACEQLRLESDAHYDFSILFVIKLMSLGCVLMRKVILTFSNI